MTKAISIELERSGFPIKIGKVELWFDSSVENLRRFFDVENIANEKLKEAQEKAKHIHFPADIDKDNIETVDVATVDAAIDVNKEFVAAQYDILFGDGSFKKVYAEFPDFMALENALDPLGIAINERIDEQLNERTKKANAKKEMYLKKKAAKKK
ncbi:hypothetical protein [Alkalicoccobacillus porphyridii]|uniref:Uncharacterized protein n=1 Tax=Alkalicoccobacillus porphyridii TaxID=2597270 RepID=A0A554A0B7_9BACI|nr:hypothetical protein [Alkalicoccobacillus porphyridii]TSB47125.1 hypothetical protein FN960_08915 [Alkalicoccobacillus porphyridii]